MNSASYSYLANAPLVSQIAFTNNGAWRMTTSKQFDQLNRLQSMASVAPTFTAASFEYTYNNANQRTERREADGVYWRYEYDPLGQVTSGKKYWADGIPVAGQQFEYAFDDIGNRTSTKAGGDQDGANLRSASYSPNLLNQYTSRTVPGAVDAMGVALATNTVTVDGFSAYRKGEYFRKELSVVNTSVPVWKSLTVSAPGETPVTRSEFVPKTPELFTHDLDGNLVADGRWNYTWDGENRLVAMAARTGVGPQISLKFEYDAQGRRIRKQVWGNAAWSGSATNDLRFVYDGWNLIAVLSPQSTVLRSFTWGLDLSGTLQGAGGVGGLLMVNDTANGVHFPAFDGNGNVAALVKSDGTLSAQYEYGPFGELLRATGSMAEANRFRFSTKYQDDESDLLIYLVRPYKASIGGWLTRDPIQEKGGMNLYAFERNDLMNASDPFGLCCKCTGPPIIKFRNSSGGEVDNYVTVRYQDPHIPGFSRIGNPVHIKFLYEGTASDCHFQQYDNGTFDVYALTGLNPPSWQLLGGPPMLPHYDVPPDYTDNVGFDPYWPGDPNRNMTYRMTIHMTITAYCQGTDDGNHTQTTVPIDGNVLMRNLNGQISFSQYAP